MEFMETIRRRQACRAFQDTQLSGAQLDALLKAANAAPVGMGHYESVHLTVVQNKDLLEKFGAVLPGDIIRKLFLAGEIADLTAQITELNGYTTQEKADKAVKN